MNMYVYKQVMCTIQHSGFNKKSKSDFKSTQGSTCILVASEEDTQHKAHIFYPSLFSIYLSPPLNPSS